MPCELPVKLTKQHGRICHDNKCYRIFTQTSVQREVEYQKLVDIMVSKRTVQLGISIIPSKNKLQTPCQIQCFRSLHLTGSGCHLCMAQNCIGLLRAGPTIWQSNAPWLKGVHIFQRSKYTFPIHIVEVLHMEV